MSDEGEFLLGRWDCTSCGTRGVLGDAYSCSGCGAPRPDDVEFYLPDDAEVIEDAAGIAAASAGPDWQCAFCDRWNPATDAGCGSCAASRADSERRQTTGAVAPRPVKPRPVAQRARVQVHARSPLPRAVWVGCGLAALTLLAGCLIFGLVRRSQLAAYQAAVAAQREVVAEKHRAYQEASAPLAAASRELAEAEARLRVAREELGAARDALARTTARLGALAQAPERPIRAHRWEVRIAQERCEAVPGEGWETPPGAVEVTSTPRQHHTERVLDRVETRYRTERYQEQDGFDTETTTERVAAGTRQVQDGYTVENLGNGRFKKTPKYRTETVYETRTKTRQVPRYVERTRQVPYDEEVYRDEPVLRPWYAYVTWRWSAAEPRVRRGVGPEPLDPEGAPPTQVPPARGALRATGRQVVLSLELGGPEAPVAEVSPERWAELADGVTVIHLAPEVLTLPERDARRATLETQRERQTAAIPPWPRRSRPRGPPARAAGQAPAARGARAALSRGPRGGAPGAGADRG
ncbi:MAG: hypothetical protein R3F62_18125 [Planctomycetota bacterium]